MYAINHYTMLPLGIEATSGLLRCHVIITPSNSSSLLLLSLLFQMYFQITMTGGSGVRQSEVQIVALQSTSHMTSLSLCASVS